MLGDRVVVNIDDLRNTRRNDVLPVDTLYLPRKVSRLGRLTRSLGLTGLTDQKLRSEWLLRELRKSNASSVFVHFLDFAVQFQDVWQRLDVPVVVHCHGYDITWDVRDSVKGTPLHPAGYRNHVRSLPDNVWFIANSTYTGDQLRSLDINPSKIFLKRFGVPLSNRPVTLSGKPKDILFLGRLVDFKGPVETVDAFSRIAGKHSGTTLHIAGGGLLANDVDRKIAERNVGSRVRCYGSVDQLEGDRLRSVASVFTAHNQTGSITGQQEAFGVSLIEAMGQGIPVVTGRSGGITDFVHHDQNGLLFMPG